MKFIYVFLLSFLLQSVNANDISFIVYHVKGNITKTSSKQILKKGDQLFLKDVLILKDASSVVLICNNYKIIQLNKKGNYSIATLVQQCYKTSASYSSSYFKYVWNELTHTVGKPEKKPGDFMKNVGAVSRGCTDVVYGMHTDTIQLSTNSKLLIHFKTFYNNGYAAIYPELYEGAALIKQKVNLTDSIQIGTLTKTLTPGIYYWQIVAEDGTSCERNYIKIWDQKEYKKIISFLLKDLPVSTPAETAFAKAFLLEENKFNAEALIWYKKAVQLNPSNQTYQQSLSSFYETKL